jgi:predicted NUDIX family NTP pyrophosphohydrolase
MMTVRSAGILLYRTIGRGLEILLVHPGGPFWRNKDLGAWQVPKGLIEPGEDEEQAARREVTEELGIVIEAPLVPLGEVRQAGGKTVVAFAAERDFDPALMVSNTIEIDWPPRSGRKLTVPEIDEARWFDSDAARRYMLPSQAPFIDRLIEKLGGLPATSLA